MQVADYIHFGGKHGESAALKNLLAHAGVSNPSTGAPLTEALCFGIAGGIGAGYSFCPSIPRNKNGSGVTVIGRHRAYASDGSWYENFATRLGATTTVTETTSQAKAQQNLLAALAGGQPVVVWCSRTRLLFLPRVLPVSDYWMHSFVIYGIDEAKQEAYGADRAATRVKIALADLAAARNGICSHKNRTLTLTPPTKLTAATLEAAVLKGLRACTAELLTPKIKTFSLAGLELWAKMITNATNKDGWRKVFQGRLLYCALRDVYHSIETDGTGGGLFRGQYADFLDEAAALTRRPTLAELAATYRTLALQWTELADAALPNHIKTCKRTKELLAKQRQLYEERGEKAIRPLADATTKLHELETATDSATALDETADTLLAELRERILALHDAESRAANRLRAAVV